MIYESYPWKQDLLKKKQLIQKYNHVELFVNDEDDKVYTIMEQAVFYSAFIIRKLVDCRGKVSDSIDSYSFRVQKIIPKKDFNVLNHVIDENSHDWEHADTVTVAGKDICNWLIHSFIFSFCLGEERIDSFFVASDYDKNKALYQVPFDNWIEYMNYVGTDYIVKMDAHYDKKLNDFCFTKKLRG